MGSGVATKQLMKMVAGSINPGKPVANLYVRRLIFVVLTLVLSAIYPVFDVESRCRRVVYRFSWRYEDGPIFEDPTTSNVSYSGLWHHSWYVPFPRYLPDLR